MAIQPPSVWITAFILALIIASFALRAHMLSRSGVVAAILLGTTVVGAAGWWLGITLVVFFVSSSIVSRIGHNPNNQARGSERDWVQVVANGWGMMFGSFGYALSGNRLWLLFALGAAAAATADTWSSEIGRTSGSDPVLITKFQRVAAGTSGAVSRRGIIAAALGAALIGLFAVASLQGGKIPADSIVVFIGVTIAGLFGALVDSLLGATVQEQRWCPRCQKRTEMNPHGCDTPTTHVAGIAGCNNDIVNVVCVLTGALLAMISGIL